MKQLALIGLLTLAGCAVEPASITTASGLRYEVLAQGEGPEAKPGDTIDVHYTGRLADGTKFDSSRDRGRPIGFVLGTGTVIRGWDEGIAGMKVGERRKLTVPPDLAYGAAGRPPKIPTNAELIFDVELIGIKK
jgi:FKBP-type peptidyl-prolyl cis-trans isomerase